MINPKYSEEFKECTGESAVCCGWEKEDVEYINENYVKWLENFVDDDKIKDLVCYAKDSHKTEDKPKEKTVTLTETF